MSKENLEQLSKDSAEAQWALFLEYYEIDLDELGDVRLGDSKEGENAKSALLFSQKKIIKAIRFGWLEITEDENDGCVYAVQRLRGKYKDLTELRYKPLNAKAKMDMGKKKETHSQIYALVASLTGKSLEKIGNLRGPDLSLVENLGGFFLVS